VATASRSSLAEDGEHPLYVGLAYAGDPEAAGTWSGTPASLGAALRQLGVSVEALRAELPRPLESAATQVLTLLRLHRIPMAPLRKRARVSRTIALYTGREMSSLRTLALRARLRRAPPLAGVVQIGTGYGLPHGLCVATFEDMTVAQALSLPYAEWRSLSDREQRAAIARQAKAYSQAMACCFATRWAADSAVHDYRVPPEKVHVVGLGRNHSPSPATRDWTTPRFLFVGGDWERKNGDAVVRAFVRLREWIPTARLDLVGRHPRLDIDGIVGHGWLALDGPDRTRLDGLFEAATCFVMPSWCEPAGIAYLEAGAAGLPCIGSTVGGSEELIGDGGCVVEPADEQALLDAMLRFSVPETAGEAGALALRRADSFTWSAVASRILAALGLAPNGDQALRETEESLASDLRVGEEPTEITRG
jgi:glycosyltransferase involved in cell wall biosynthesis